MTSIYLKPPPYLKQTRNDRRFEAKTKLRKFLTSRNAMQCIATCTLEINQNKEMLSKRLLEKLSLKFFCQA